MSNKTSFPRTLVILVIVSLVFLSGCGGGASQSFNNQPPPPTPTITTISPNSTVAGGVAFTLAINGINFVSGSTVYFGGAAPATTFVNSTQLTAAIPAAAIASTGTAAVTVTNPGGRTSNVISFSIISGTNPVPAINFLSPNSVPAGEQDFGLLLNGQSFVPGSVVRWNGNDRPTTFYNSSQLSAQISASDIAGPGTAAVTVFNPAPGGGGSNSLTFTTTTGGVNPQSIVVDPTGKFAYVADMGSAYVNTYTDYVSIYAIDATTGALTSLGPPVPTNDEGARSVTVDPLGKFLYVANWGVGDTAGSISMYSINATTGALASIGTIDAACPGSGCSLLAPWSVAVDSSGKFAYVANEGGLAPTTVATFAIDTTTGSLTSTGAISSGGRALSVAVDATGKFAYVATGSDPPGSAGNVSMYAINASTGALTSIGTIAAGTDPVSIFASISVAVDPTGKFVYVSNPGSNDVSMYTINTATGALTPIGTLPAGSTPTSIAVHPSGNFAYVTNSSSNDVSMYTIDGTTGALTSIGTIAAGTGPVSVAVDPSGKFAYVANSGSNNVSMYSIDATTGALTLIGTIGT